GLAELVRELHDQDAVLRHQAYQRDEPDLAVDVERGEAEEREQQRPGNSQRRRAREDHERIAEALELRGEQEEDEDRRQPEDREELAALGAELARLAGVVHGEARRQHLLRFPLEEAQRLIE